MRITNFGTASPKQPETTVSVSVPEVPGSMPTLSIHVEFVFRIAHATELSPQHMRAGNPPQLFGEMSLEQQL